MADISLVLHVVLQSGLESKVADWCFSDLNLV